MEYILKENMKEIIKNKTNNRKIARKLGVTEGYVSQIINKRKTKISKLMAYGFCKAVDSELEIEDMFDIM